MILSVTALSLYYWWTRYKREERIHDEKRRRNEKPPVVPATTTSTTRCLPLLFAPPPPEPVVQRSPEEIELCHLLNQFMVTPGEQAFVALVAMGDIYTAGAYPRFRPNDTLGHQCYQLAAQSLDGMIAGTAQSKFIAARLNPVLTADRRGVPLPPEYGELACEEARRRLRDHMHEGLFIVQHRRARPRQRPIDEFIRTERIPPAVHVPQAVRVFNIQRIIAPPPAVAVNGGNAQNTHDSAVIAGLGGNIKALTKGSWIEDPALGTAQLLSAPQISTLKRDVHDALACSGLNPLTILEAQRVLQSLSGLTHGTFGVSEIQALSLVWSKLQSIDDPTMRTNLIETLAQQLASAVELGNVVCSTGRIARIVSSLDGTEIPGMKQLRTIETVREELGSLAAKTRDDHLKLLSDTEKEAYESGETTDATTAISEAMKVKFRNEVQKVYITELGMSKSVLDPLTSVLEDVL